MQLDFQVIVDSPCATDLVRVFRSYWPAYRRWMRQAPVETFEGRRAQLRRHMPELLDTFDQLHARFGGTDDIGRFLSLYRPPPVVRACTQLVLDAAAGPVLLRSYDHHPERFDGVILQSAWDSTPCLAVTDCLLGALDGMNGHGLAIALAFGGRNVVGDGFAAPLICRYVLQTCTNVAEARAALSRLPVYMPYTFAVVDGAGEFVTAFMGPDIQTSFVTRRASANHQGRIEWSKYARFVETAARLERAESLIDPACSLDAARRAFLSAPLWRTSYQRAAGTLYVAEYAPAARTLDLHWPTRSERVRMGDTQGRTFAVELTESALL